MLKLWLVLALTALPLAAAPVVRGDYDAEPRRGEHVDLDALLQRLTELHANTYQWLLWHSSHDWEDLQAFLPRARQAGIQVWAYLVPPSESGQTNPKYPYSEPYRCDYVRWATEIGRLSLVHDNLVGYVIDDFVGNLGTTFKPDYLRQVVAAGKAVNPKLKFYPLLYYPEITERLCRTLAPVIDGAVAAYPADEATVKQAVAALNDELALPAAVDVVFPADTHSTPGQHGCAVQRATVTDAEHARLRVRYRDSYDGPTTGYHKLQVRVDEQVVWEGDTGGSAAGEAVIDLRQAVAGKAQVTLRLGLWEAKGVAQYAVEAEFGDLRVEGLTLQDADLSSGAWTTETTGPFTLERRPAYTGRGRYHVPLLIMPAGSRGEYRARHKEEATPERVAERVRWALGLADGQRVLGVVIYCLDKRPGNPDLAAVAKVYAAQAAKDQ